MEKLIDWEHVIVTDAPDKKNSMFLIYLRKDYGMLLTVDNIQQKVGTEELEKIIDNTELSEEHREELINQQIVIFMACYLGMKPHEAQRSIAELGDKETLQRAWDIYYNEVIPYKTPFGTFSVIRQDISLINNAYRAIACAVVFIVGCKLFSTATQNLITYIIGSIIFLLLSINNIRITNRVWRRHRSNEKNSQ